MIPRAIRDQVRAMLRPLRNRVDNMIARGVVTLVNNAAKMQKIQVGIQEGETADDVEHFQPFGFKSVPLDGAESILLFVGGDRNAPVAVVTDDRRSRPTGWAKGESGTYNEFNTVVRLRADGTIEAGSIGGTFKALAFKDELDDLAAHVDGHEHHQWGYPGGVVDMGTVVSTSPPTVSVTAAPGGTPDASPAAVGTAKLKGE